MVLAAIILPNAFKLIGMVLPLAIGGACVVTSIIGTYFVKLGADNNIMGSLYKGIIATGVLSLVALLPRSEGHTSELQSLMRISYAVFCLKKTKNKYERSRKFIHHI